jgi:hypothetical protein
VTSPKNAIRKAAKAAAAPKPEGPKPTHAAIPIALWQEIDAFLGTLPFAQVAPLIGKINKDGGIQGVTITEPEAPKV